MAHILLVDDDADQLELRQMLLEQAGHQADAATSMEGAMSLLATTPYAAVVTDLRLPSLEDGLQLIRAIRGTHPRTRIIVTCGWPADLDGRAESAMIDKIMPKPVATAKLLKFLGKLDGPYLGS